MPVPVRPEAMGRYFAILAVFQKNNQKSHSPHERSRASRKGEIGSDELTIRKNQVRIPGSVIPGLASDSRYNLACADSEYLCSTDGTDTLGCRLAIFHRNLLRILDFSLGLALDAISLYHSVSKSCSATRYNSITRLVIKSSSIFG